LSCHISFNPLSHPSRLSCLCVKTGATERQREWKSVPENLLRDLSVFPSLRPLHLAPIADLRPSTFNLRLITPTRDQSVSHRARRIQRRYPVKHAAQFPSARIVRRKRIRIKSVPLVLRTVRPLRHELRALEILHPARAHLRQKCRVIVLDQLREHFRGAV